MNKPGLNRFSLLFNNIRLQNALAADFFSIFEFQSGLFWQDISTMQPIHELLNRIHWDPEFGEGQFELDFLDRLEASLIRLPFREIVIIPGDHFFFHYIDEEGAEHSVPYHRIRSVYKNGERIWHRGD